MTAKNKGIAGATLEGVKGGFKKGAEYDESKFNVVGKQCLITGANGGLGKGIAIRMARLGVNVTMAGRTLDEQARTDIIEASKNNNVTMEKLDLASFQSVRDFCARIKETNRHFDIVVLNAATVAKEGRLTEDNLDTMTQVNFLSNVLLIETLLKNNSIRSDRKDVSNDSFSSAPIEEGVSLAERGLSESNHSMSEFRSDTKDTPDDSFSSAPIEEGVSLAERGLSESNHSMSEFRSDTKDTPDEIPRIVVVSSEAHRWSESINLDTLDQPRTFKMKNAMKVYSDTKFMMAAYTAHLAKRLTTADGPRIAIHAHCPGAVNSNLAREAPSFLRPLLQGIFFLFFASPHKASRPAVHLACTPSLEGKTGLYYHLLNEKQFDHRALNEPFQEQLLQQTLRIIAM